MGHRYVSLHAILNGDKAAAPLPYAGESLKNASPERAPVGVLSPQRQYTEDVARLSKRSLGTVGPASLRFHRGCGVNHVIFIGSESEKVRGEKRDGEMPHICGCHSIFSGGSLTSFPGSVRSTAPFGRGRTARKQPGAAGGIRDNEDHNDVGMQENEVDACQFRRQKKKTRIPDRPFSEPPPPASCASRRLAKPPLPSPLSPPNSPDDARVSAVSPSRG